MKLIENVKTYTNNEFIKKSEMIHKDSDGLPLYDYSKTKYIGSKYPVIIICKKCGNEFTLRASHHRNGVGCKICAHKRLSELRRSNTTNFIKKSKNIHNDKYNYDNVNYIDNITPVLIHCNNCNSLHINGNGCPKCARKKHSKFMSDTIDSFIKKAKLKHVDYKGEPLYDYSETNYNGSMSTVTIKCKKCGNFFSQRASHHLNGSGCLNCNKSRGEKYIENKFKLHNIDYITQKRFDDCRNKIPLPFDFYLPKYNLCVEFDGTHHYEIKKIHGGFDRLVKQKENDRIKTKYCYTNNIKLYRIKYTDNLKDSIQDIFDYIKNNFSDEI